MSDETSRLDGVILKRKWSERGNFQSRRYRPSLARVSSVALLPLVLVAALSVAAWHFWNIVPPGDPMMRWTAVLPCVAMALVMFGFAVAVFATRALTVEVEAARVSVRSHQGWFSSGWDGVALGQVRSRMGVRELSVSVAGRSAVVVSLFFPDFDELRATLSERLDAFQQAGASL
ncbi:MAG: hypothetical protein FJX76_18675 [Armatimonadetes bacterium]|nr:hypothetical protein [Armatimonadota bacterium]